MCGQYLFSKKYLEWLVGTSKTSFTLLTSVSIINFITNDECSGNQNISLLHNRSSSRKKKYLQYIVVRESHPAIFTDPVLSKMSNEKVCQMPCSRGKHIVTPSIWL